MEDVEKLVELTVREKELDGKIKAMKEALKTKMDNSSTTRLETKMGVAFISSGSSVRIDKNAALDFENYLRENGIEPDFRYKRIISYVRVFPDTEIPKYDPSDFEDIDEQQLVDEIIKLSATKSFISQQKKELSKKVLSTLKKFGKIEEYADNGYVKVIEYEKEFIDTDKIKEYAETMSYPIDKIFKKKSYERFVVVDWSAYQKMLEHIDDS